MVFFNLIQDVKYWLSATQDGNDRGLYDYYLLGLGQLFSGVDGKALTFLNFCTQMENDEAFKSYCNRLLWYVKSFAGEDFAVKQLASSRVALNNVTRFLELQQIVAPSCIKFNNEIHAANVRHGWKLPSDLEERIMREYGPVGTRTGRPYSP